MRASAARSEETSHHHPADDGAAAVRRLIAGYQSTYLMQIAAELGLADLLAAGPRSLEELAGATASRPDALRRVLFALAQLGVLARNRGGRYAPTRRGEALRGEIRRASRRGRGYGAS
jgi:hypothetical protein